MQYLRLLCSLLPSMHANIIRLAVRTSPSISFTYLLICSMELASPPPQPPTLPSHRAPLPRLTALLPCWTHHMALHSSDHVLPQAQALCTRMGRKGKLTRKWLATPRFAKMHMCVSVGVGVSTHQACLPTPLLKHLMMLPHPSISHRPQRFGEG